MKKIITIKFNKDNIYKSSQTVQNGVHKDEGIAGSDVFTFELDEGRHFMCKSNSWELNSQDIESMNVPNLQVTPGSDIDLTDKKLYRFPKLHLPRQKVDLLKDKYNCKVVRNPDAADMHIISLKFLQSIFSYTWDNAYTYKELYIALKHMLEKNKFNDEGAVDIKTTFALLDKDAMYVMNDRHYYYGNDQHVADWYETFTCALSDAGPSELNKIVVLQEKNREAFENLSRSSKQIVFDTDITNVIDSELAVIDNDQYNDIQKMIQSTDMDNRSLAVEMLANCNIEQSFDVVSGMFWWNYDAMKNTSNWNTVNVKAMRTRMKEYQGYNSNGAIYQYDNYIKKLAKDGKLTKFAKDNTRKRLYKTVLCNLVGGTSAVFKVSYENMDVADEFKSMIND